MFAVAFKEIGLIMGKSTEAIKMFHTGLPKGVQCTLRPHRGEAQPARCGLRSSSQREVATPKGCCGCPTPDMTLTAAPHRPFSSRSEPRKWPQVPSGQTINDSDPTRLFNGEPGFCHRPARALLWR